MPWWQWIVLGAVLLGAELFVVDTTFYLAILGLAALLVGLGAGVGLMAGPLWFQLAVFGVLSVGLLVGVRRHFYRRLRGGPAEELDPVVGETATVAEPIEPGGTGRAQLRGSEWTARNAGRTAIAPGQRVRVRAVRDLVLELDAEEQIP